MFDRDAGPLNLIRDSIVIWWDEWIGWIQVSLLWILAWLTILLGPPATFGIYQVASQFIRGEFTGFAGMVEGGRKHFWRSWLWMVATALGLVVILSNILFYSQREESWARGVQGVMVFLAFLWLAIQFYALPFFIVQEKKSLILAWRNAFLTILASPIFALLLISLSLAITLLSFVTILPLILGFPGLVAVLMSAAVLNRLRSFKILGSGPDEEVE